MHSSYSMLNIKAEDWAVDYRSDGFYSADGTNIESGILYRSRSKAF